MQFMLSFNEKDIQGNPEILDKLRGLAELVAVGNTAQTAEDKPVAEDKTAAKGKPTPEEEIAVSEVDARTKLIALRDSKGKEAAKAVLGEFGATKFPELKAEQYAAFVQRIGEEMV